LGIVILLYSYFFVPFSLFLFYFFIDVISSQLELHRLSTGNEPRVTTAMTRLKQKLFQYQGHISAALVLGGIDIEGSHLYTVHPHGSVDRLPYATMGSGSLAAMAVLENGYKDDLNESEAIELVSQAIQSGIFNDLGSGSNVDITVITKGKTESENSVKYLRNFLKPNPRLYTRKAGYDFPRGSTEWRKETEIITKSKQTYETQDTNLLEKGGGVTNMQMS
jgi:20S proteasome subunit beta 2